jgi:hypothetical protein
MTIQDQYLASARRAQDSWTTVTESWTQSFGRAVDQIRLPLLPVAPFDATTAVTQWFDAAQRLLQANRTYAKSLVGVANAFDGALREQTASTAQAVRSQVGNAVDTAVENVERQVEELDRSAREQAEALQQADEERRREERAAERQRAREARSAARERYEALRKGELVDALAERGLPKTGNVDELIERLVDADTK